VQSLFTYYVKKQQLLPYSGRLWFRPKQKDLMLNFWALLGTFMTWGKPNRECKRGQRCQMLLLCRGGGLGPINWLCRLHCLGFSVVVLIQEFLSFNEPNCIGKGKKIWFFFFCQLYYAWFKPSLWGIFAAGFQKARSYGCRGKWVALQHHKSSDFLQELLEQSCC